MKRRNFIKGSLLGSAIPYEYFKLFSGINSENHPELKKHKISRVERLNFNYNWPRHVGKNARKEITVNITLMKLSSFILTREQLVGD